MLPKIHCCTSKIPVSFSSAQPSCAPFIRRPPGSSTARPAVAAALQFLDDTRLVRRRNLGRAVRRRPGPNGRSAGSMTWAGLLNTYYWIDPQKHVAAVYMSQVLPFADKPALALYRRFERGVYDAVKAA